MKKILILFFCIALSFGVYGQKTKDNGGGGGGKTNVPNTNVTNVNIIYSGDQWGCALPITVTIGNRSFQPQGNSVVMTGVPIGQQRYVIQGQIHCPGFGSCNAYGEGVVNVLPNSRFFIVWQNTGPNQCSIGLSMQ